MEANPSLVLYPPSPAGQPSILTETFTSKPYDRTLMSVLLTAETGRRPVERTVDGRDGTVGSRRNILKSRNTAMAERQIDRSVGTERLVGEKAAAGVNAMREERWIAEAGMEGLPGNRSPAHRPGGMISHGISLTGLVSFDGQRRKGGRVARRPIRPCPPAQRSTRSTQPLPLVLQVLVVLVNQPSIPVIISQPPPTVIVLLSPADPITIQSPVKVLIRQKPVLVPLGLVLVLLGIVLLAIVLLRVIRHRRV